MTRTFILFFALASMAVFNGCKDKENGDEPVKSAETTAEFDKSNFGLYKGIIVGSSGTIKIEINNGNNVVKATITIDGKTDVLTCNSSPVNGQAMVNVVFSGSFSSFTFSVDADGKNPVIVNITIDGHSNVAAAVAKETSANVASAYEGTGTGGNNARGVLNIVRNSNTFSGYYKSLDEQSQGLTFSVSGTVGNDGAFSGTSKSKLGAVLDVTLTYSGKFSGDNVSGTWKTSWEGGTNSGSFTGKKTL